MSLLIKAGIVGGLGTSVIVPVAITSSTDARSVGLLDLESLGEIQEPAPKNSTLAAFYKAGYRKKSKDRLADFNKNREERIGGNFALGCHRLLFGGRNVPRLSFSAGDDTGKWAGNEPMDGYLGDKNQPLLGCSTASFMTMTWPSKGNVYEFELAVRRGDIGFLERITVWENTKEAQSQLVIYTKKNSGNQYSWFNLYGIHRRATKKEEFEIRNPKDKAWTDLRFENSSQGKPNYFTVWIENKKEDSSDKSMLGNLGIKIKSNKKLFSSIAKTDNKNDWYFNFYETNKNSDYSINVNSYPNVYRYYATYNSKIASEVESFRGSWQDVTEFCASQEGKEKGSLPYEDAERLRDYCYTNQKAR